MTTRITDKPCRETMAPASGYRFILFSEVRGLALRVTARGVKSFAFSYTNPHRRQRRLHCRD